MMLLNVQPELIRQEVLMPEFLPNSTRLAVTASSQPQRKPTSVSASKMLGGMTVTSGRLSSYKSQAWRIAKTASNSVSSVWYGKPQIAPPASSSRTITGNNRTPLLPQALAQATW
jgi:hypothetical protein